ncbi:MAG: DUF1772 domain-containing protein [Chitinophagaceae bacterium]|nr:DUF1772 domain-containing protein [Chitinophagaceae bacterium]MCW5916958.1 DUF1772 domain-containing protein [Ferruginibacter sp.]
MKKAGQLFLIIAIICWAGILGAVLYAHIAVMPSLLSHLPESWILESGPYPIRDEIFWKLIHPFSILFTIITLIVNWKILSRRKLIAGAAIIYLVALIATYTYFVPELMEFVKSAQNTSVTAAEWLERGQRWQHLSWIRGAFMLSGFVLLLLALSKSENTASFPEKRF